jgi:hypothetical protein
MNEEIFVGVVDLHLQSSKACHFNNDLFAAINLSFTLEGAFMLGAKSDALNDTVDYDALCRALTKVLDDFCCLSPVTIAMQAQRSIRQFSAKITGGYVNVGVLCHVPFPVEQALL